MSDTKKTAPDIGIEYNQYKDEEKIKKMRETLQRTASRVKTLPHVPTITSQS